MKQSIYNYLFETEDSSYWFNCLTRSQFRLSQNAGIKLRALLDNLDSLSKGYPWIYSKLRDTGFIVDDSFNELATAIELNEKEVESKSYILTLIPTLNCNFNCHYCIQNHVPSMMSDEIINRVCRHIDHVIQNKNIEELNIEWFGGEPFMMLNSVVKHISEYAMLQCEKHSIKFHNTATTNAYYLTSETVNLLKKLKFERFQITLDGPREIHNKVKYCRNCDSTFDHILNNVRHLLAKIDNLHILLRINFTKQNLNEELFHQIMEYLHYSDRTRVTITLKKVWQEEMETSDYETVVAFAKLVASAGFNTSFSDIITGRTPCYVSRKFYNCINYNGKVYKCTACDDLYDEEKGGTLLGNGIIEWKDDLDKKSIEKTYNNDVCLNCRFLPICYGLCPRDHINGVKFCKLAIGMPIQAQIKNLIDINYALDEIYNGN